MKRFRFVLPVLIAALTITLSAFTADTKDNQNVNQLWYEFTGGDPAVATNYEVLGNGMEAPICFDGSVRCAVKASAHPTLGAEYPDLQDEEIEIRNKD
jgi:hypothetical protein